jgi:hypothetical protein
MSFLPVGELFKEVAKLFLTLVEVFLLISMSMFLLSETFKRAGFVSCFTFRTYNKGAVSSKGVLTMLVITFESIVILLGDSI